jgi:hypothetical protein
MVKTGEGSGMRVDRQLLIFVSGKENLIKLVSEELFDFRCSKILNNARESFDAFT